MSFIESPRFPECISYGATGGPAYKTDVVVVNSGYEQRNATWAQARSMYDVSHAARDPSLMKQLIAFFRAAKGRALGFRFKDWLDYEVEATDGRLGTGPSTGVRDYQLTKVYTAGTSTEYRDIRKPVLNSVKVYSNGVEVTQGTSAGNCAIDYTTGVVSFVHTSTKNVNATVTRNITAITKASPGVITTSVAHGFNNGDQIKMLNVGGMAELNNNYYTITVVSTTQFSIGVNTTSFTTFTTGGTANKYGVTQTNPIQINSTVHGFSNGDYIYFVSSIGTLNQKPFIISNVTTDRFTIAVDGTSNALSTSTTLFKYLQPGVALTWDGEFDVPVRFETDRINVEIIAPEVQGWQQIPLVEIRT